MKVSKYQFDDNVLNLVTYDDFHQAVEDEIAIYSYNNQKYIVIELFELIEEEKHPYVVFKYNGKLIGIEKDINIVNNILKQYEQDN